MFKKHSPGGCQIGSCTCGPTLPPPLCSCIGGFGDFKLRLVVSGTPTRLDWSCGDMSPQTGGAPTDGFSDLNGTYDADCWLPLYAVSSAGYVRDPRGAPYGPYGCFRWGYSPGFYPICFGITNPPHFRIRYVMLLHMYYLPNGTGVDVGIESYADIPPALPSGHEYYGCRPMSFARETFSFSYGSGESWANGNCPSGIEPFSSYSNQAAVSNCCDVSGYTFTLSMLSL